MNIEHLRRSLKAKWLGYYRENRTWLTRLGVWVNCEGNRRPSSSFILATLSVIEPQLTQMLPLVVDLSSNPDRIVMALGLNFNPDEELTAIEQASPEEMKMLPPFSVALPRLVQPIEAQTIAAQTIAAQTTELQATKPHKAESKSSDESGKRHGSQPNQPLSLSKPNPDKPISDKPISDKSSQSQPDESGISSLPKAVLLERPKAPAPSFGEPVVKQRPPMDTAELAHGQQPDRGTVRKRKSDRPAPPAHT
jgi:hypothetical protein